MKKLKFPAAPFRIIGETKVQQNFDPSLMFEPLAFREINSEAMNDYMRSRENSDDPEIRTKANLGEGYLSLEDFHKVNSRDIPETDIQLMKQIGYRILEFGQFNWDIVVSALEIFKNNFGHINVPADYIIDEEIINLDLGFDESYENLNLGEAVESIRIGDVDGLEDPIRKSILDSLGFDWGDKSKYQRYRFPPLFIALKIYSHLYGDPLPNFDFIVPDEPQWPYWMVGIPLGKWTALLRVQQKMIKQHYEDRHDILIAMDFMWWIPPPNHLQIHELP